MSVSPRLEIAGIDQSVPRVLPHGLKQSVADTWTERFRQHQALYHTPSMLQYQSTACQPHPRKADLGWTLAESTLAMIDHRFSTLVSALEVSVSGAYRHFPSPVSNARKAA